MDANAIAARMPRRTVRDGRAMFVSSSDAGRRPGMGPGPGLSILPDVGRLRGSGALVPSPLYPGERVRVRGRATARGIAGQRLIDQHGRGSGAQAVP